MKYRIHFLLLAFIIMSVLCGKAQDVAYTDSTTNIVAAILDADNEVVIVQPEVLSQRLMPFAVIKTTGRHDKKVDPNIRYRIQVFSDNNRQTAKANAEYRKRLIEQYMPGIIGYVTYDAPYWRVRIGNYQTEAEALTAMKQIKSQFPAFASDVRVVKVRVGN